MRELVPLVLVLGVACSSGGSTPAASPSRAEPGAAEGGASPALEGKTVVLSVAQPNPSIHPGDRVVIELRESSQGISPEYRHGWGDATVSGDALRFVETETVPPPPDVDGGSTLLRYAFRAEGVGEATITIPVTGAGEEAMASDFRVEVEVTAP
ncbi:MAG: hypothetical protein H6712_31875 [Myxococcales bacterium]|nr:hypothetical protein [Myxococcales bacterium]MCB9718492.1 hypothetical protein [Myxococcales bacterium]